MVYMEVCGARRSFEKPRVEPPPAHLQVIGFDVSPNMKAAEAAAGESFDNMVSSAAASSNELFPSLSKPASSPRSALQQLLHHHPLPSTSPTSSNHQLPPLLPSLSSSNQNSTSGLLQRATSSPPVEANQKWTGGISRPESPTLAAAYQSNSSSGHVKSLLKSECTNLDIPVNQNFRNSFFSSLTQSQYTYYSSLSSAGNQMINQHDAKPSCKALIKENYEAFFLSKSTHGDGNDAKAHEGKSRSIHAKEVINDQLPPAPKSRKSSWLCDDDDDDNNDDLSSAAEKCKKGSWKGVKQISEVSFVKEKSRKNRRSEEESKKSSLFMFVASSPAPEFHHHHHRAEYNASIDMGFLSSCHLCRRHLGEGQDVFMYSGDKAFCSMECRYQQIVIDERKERCPPQIIRSGASPVLHCASVTAPTTHHPIMINKPHFINTAAAA